MKNCQTEKYRAELLRVDYVTGAKRLKALGMIQKERNWVPYELRRGLSYPVCPGDKYKENKEKRIIRGQWIERITI